MRLELHRFTLDGPTDSSQPNLAGLCTTDRQAAVIGFGGREPTNEQQVFEIFCTRYLNIWCRMEISVPGGPANPVLCGENSGQHLLVDIETGAEMELKLILRREHHHQ